MVHSATFFALQIFLSNVLSTPASFFRMDYSDRFARFVCGCVCLAGYLGFAPMRSVAELPLMFPVAVLSGDELAKTELDTTWVPMPLWVSLAVIEPEEVESFPAGMQEILAAQPMVDQSFPIILTVPATPNDWHESLCQPLAFVPDTSGHVPPKASVIIPTMILSAESSQTTKVTKEKIDLVPLILNSDTTADKRGQEDIAGELDKEIFKTEFKILETLWNVDFKMGMQETSEDSNRAGLGMVARYKTPGQLLKIDMEFERNQGDEEQVANQLRLGTLARYRWEGKKLEIDMKYERRQDDQENITNRVLLDGMHEWSFNSTRWSHYLGGKVEYDQTKEFDGRFETNTGFAFSVLKNRSSHVKLKAGTTVLREIGIDQEEVDLSPDSLYGVSINQQVTTALKILTSVDYIPQWSDFRQYEVQAQANWQIFLDEDRDLRLKVGAQNRYESSMPIESIVEGTDYTTSLMWVY